MARTAVDEIDVSALLAKVNVPTLVFHSVRDKQVPFEQGRIIATSIPNAKFVALEGENHTLLPGEPAWTQFVDEMENFLQAKVRSGTRQLFQHGAIYSLRQHPPRASLRPPAA